MKMSRPVRFILHGFTFSVPLPCSLLSVGEAPSETHLSGGVFWSSQDGCRGNGGEDIRIVKDLHLQGKVKGVVLVSPGERRMRRVKG